MALYDLDLKSHSITSNVLFVKVGMKQPLFKAKRHSHDFSVGNTSQNVQPDFKLLNLLSAHKLMTYLLQIKQTPSLLGSSKSPFLL